MTTDLTTFIADSWLDASQIPRNSYSRHSSKCVYQSTFSECRLITAPSNLEPGGYLEFQDYGLPCRSVDDTLDGTSLEKWGILMCEAARKLGRPMGTEVSEKYREWMEAAGFVDIEEQHFMWPSNTWPKDKYMKELGNWNMINILEGLEGFCLALMTRGLGWKKEEVDVFVAKVSSDVKNRGIHAYYPMPVVWGRKPLTAN